MAGTRDMRQEVAKGSRGFIISFSRHFYSYNLLHMAEFCAAEMTDALAETFKRRVNDFCSYTTNICLF
jgi:hypothetical protein